MGKNYCFFAAHFLPSYGGVEKYTYALAKKLIARGNHVSVVTSQLSNQKEKERIDGIEVYRLPCYKLLNGRFPVYHSGNKAKALFKELDQHHFDFMVVQTRFYIHSYIGVKYAKKRSIPCIVIEHGSTHNTIGNAFADKIGAGYEHFITNRVKHYCSSFFGVSTECCKWLEHFHIHSKGVLYNAVDVTEFQRKENQASQENRGVLDVFFAGRLVYDKGILQLTEAVCRLNKEGLNIRLSIAGDGVLSEQLKQEETSEIVMLGRLDFDQMIERYYSSDIFCLPSDHEGFSTTLLEAAACRCFIITTNTGGAKELLPDDDYGIVMEGNTTEDIMRAIRRASQDSQYRKNAAEKAYNMVAQRFSWDQVCEQLIHVEEAMNAVN